ncbi:MAG: hypothetical protein DI626_05800 [Micavibrio aeruginosavorus]|uniref:Uncharacterized protein n=1 Tax=Micavibrio aeruginosavorus TaxID=349221 RepID=A0A2W4ZWN0_9BACT|nr:MAG: hypothetical protein DI626_05800 [Micavibrio aeruginosavorus]
MYSNGTHFEKDQPAALSAINRSISDFIWTKAPTREIDLAITWLEGITHDCQYKIIRLRALKAERDRSQTYKRKKAAVSDLFDDPDFLSIDSANQILIIQQRLGAACSWQRAQSIRETIVKKLVRVRREERDRRIIRQIKSGVSPTEIAAQEKLTRQQVYNIANKADKSLF